MFERLENHDLHTEKTVYVESPKLMPYGSLKDLDLDQELYQTYHKAKIYLESLEYDDEVLPNQRAQVINTVTSILKEIVKTQTELHNAERVKALEAAMISALKLAPEEVQERFFTELARLTKDET